MARSKKAGQLKAKEIIGKKVLILGEVGSGKTLLTAKLVRELMLLIEPKKITIVDMAPEKKGEIGGKLSHYLSLSNEVRYLSPSKVYTPRISADSPAKVVEYAERNKKSIDPLLDEFIKKPTEVLVINDITIYLQLGELEKILNCIRLSETFLANAYYGVKLTEDYGTGISDRERRLVNKLVTYMDYAIRLGDFCRT